MPPERHRKCLLGADDLGAPRTQPVFTDNSDVKEREMIVWYPLIFLIHLIGSLVRLVGWGNG